MDTLQHNPDHDVIARYTGQPLQLPPELRREIEAHWHGAAVQLYALADLDHAHRLTAEWVALGAGHVAVAQHAGEQWELRSVERARIEAVREAPGLSANRGTRRSPCCAIATASGAPSRT